MSLLRGRIDPATGVFTPCDQPEPEPVVKRIDPDTAAHEARHAAAALMLGLDVKEVRADNPSPNTAGLVRLCRYSDLKPREAGVMTLMGYWGEPGWPPESPCKQEATPDERRIAGDVETLGLGQAGYELMVADAENLAAKPAFKSLAGMLELFLARGCVLREDQIDQIHKACGKAALEHKTLKTAARTRTELGEFSAIAAATRSTATATRSSGVRSIARSSVGRPAASGSRCTGTTAQCEGHHRVDRPRLDAGDRRRAVRPRQARP